MDRLLNDIISIFIDRKIRHLRTVDISEALNKNGISCTTSDILTKLTPYAPTLFKLKANGSFTIVQVDPQIDICENFQLGRCHLKLKPCDNLHICRYFGRYHPGCKFPHALTYGQNLCLIQERNLQNIDEILLIELIRLKTTVPASATPEIDINRQINVFFPISASSDTIDMELIGLLLKDNNIQIESATEESTTRHFQRATLELQSIADVEKVLAKPIIHHDDVDIKFKRRKLTTDRTCFLLKTPIDRVEDKIFDSRLPRYIKTLVGNESKSTSTDISTDTEHIVLVQCDHELDFNRVYQEHQLRPKLRDRPMTLAHIYQYDTVIVRNIDEKRVMHHDDLQHIFADSWGNIFSFKFPNGPTAEVEFLTSAGLKEWLKNVESIKDKFKITVVPVIKEMSDREDPLKSSGSAIPESNCVIVQLEPDWELIANHPLFQDEMKTYFHDRLGGDIEVKGAELTYTHPATLNTNHDPITMSLIKNTISVFMQNFIIETLSFTNDDQLPILKTHSRTAVWKRQYHSNYRIGAKHNEMRALKLRLCVRPNSPNGSGNSSTSSSRSGNYQLRLSDFRASSSPYLPEICYYQLKSSDQLSMFDIDGFDNRLTQYLEDKYRVTIRVEKNRTINEKRITIQIEGTLNEMHKTENELKRLFSSLKTQIFDDNNYGQWTKMDEAIDVIRHHLNGERWLYICQRVTPKSIKITHFDEANQDFGVDERKITSLINDRFKGATTNLPSQSVSQDLMKAWNELQEEIQKKINYRKDICLVPGQSSVYLFGLTRLVDESLEDFKKLTKKLTFKVLKIDLNEQQKHYLDNVVEQEFAKLIKDWQTQGCEFDPVRFHQRGEIIAPPQMHQKIKEDLKALTDCSTAEFEINDAAFHSLVSSKFDDVLKIVKSKCFVQKETRIERISIPIPRTKSSNAVESMTATAPNVQPGVSSAERLRVGQSSIDVLIGDLTQQKADVIVVNMASMSQCPTILRGAGLRVKAEYETEKAKKSPTFFTSCGDLPCKRILFLTVSTKETDIDNIQPLLRRCIQSAIDLTVKHKFKSLAFPTIGCEKLGFNLALVAKSMIGETYLQLLNNNFTLDVSFVLMSNEQNAYKQFKTYFNSLEPVVVNAPTVTPTTTQRMMDITSLPYDEKIVKITLISSSSRYLSKCKAEIEELAEQNSFERTLSDKKDLLDWSQQTTTDFYKYCLNMDVIPTVDFDQLTVHLKGDKDAVHEAEKRFFELTTNTFREARGIIWSVEKAHGSNDWEQYSFKNIGEIEDAYLKKRSQVDVTNEQSELCHIIFDKMEEQYHDRRRRIRRSETDSPLPNYWEETSENLKRVTLRRYSQEFQKVIKHFDDTMKERYQKIIRIERIQNERWYRQYVARHEAYKKVQSEPDKRVLFHGCTNDTAEKIVQEGFNRSFAGIINGALFGQGVYFNADANYSHNYAKPGSDGERTMFFAHVLIGKTIRGNPTLQVAPKGYETTTDTGKLFVIYHDTGAYGEYLITYQ